MEARIRKYKNNLVVSGMGTIAFGVWSVVKVTMYAFLDKENLLGSYSHSSGFVIALIYFFLYSILAVDLLIRYKAGRAAIRVGKGIISHSARPVVEGSIVLLYSLFCVVLALIFGSSQAESYADVVTSVIIETSSLFAVAEMVYSAIMIEHLQKLQKTESVV